MGLFASPGVVEKSRDGSASRPCCSPASPAQHRPTRPAAPARPVLTCRRLSLPIPAAPRVLSQPHISSLQGNGEFSPRAGFNGSRIPLAFGLSPVSPVLVVAQPWGAELFFPGREPLGFSIWEGIPPLTPCWGHPWVLIHPFSIGCGGFLEGSDILLLLCQGINHSHLLSVVSRNISGSCNSSVQFLFCFLVSCQKTAFVVPLCKTLVGSLLGAPRQGFCWSHKIIFGFCCSVPDPWLESHPSHPRDHFHSGLISCFLISGSHQASCHCHCSPAG